MYKNLLHICGISSEVEFVSPRDKVVLSPKAGLLIKCLLAVGDEQIT